MKSSLLLRCLAALGAVFALFLAGCGSGSTYEPFIPTRVIAFGDGFSAVNNSGETLVGVRNTTPETNSTVASRIASYYGITLAPASGAVASTGGFAFIPTSNTGATWGRISEVDSQITSFLASNSVQSGDMFVITVGGLDIYDVALGSGTIDGVTTTLANAIKRLTDAGAKHVLYMMPINMARTPWGLNSTNPTPSAIQDLSYDSSASCNSFQCKLTLKLSNYYPATSNGNAVLVADLQAYFNLLSGTTATGNANTFASYGVANPNLPICTTNTTSLTSTLGCDSTQVSTGTNSFTSTAYDWTTSLFANNWFLTPLGNRLLADYIFNTSMLRAGWR